LPGEGYGKQEKDGEGGEGIGVSLVRKLRIARQGQQGSNVLSSETKDSKEGRWGGYKEK